MAMKASIVVYKLHCQSGNRENCNVLLQEFQGRDILLEHYCEAHNDLYEIDLEFQAIWEMPVVELEKVTAALTIDPSLKIKVHCYEYGHWYIGYYVFADGIWNFIN